MGAGARIAAIHPSPFDREPRCRARAASSRRGGRLQARRL